MCLSSISCRPHKRMETLVLTRKRLCVSITQWYGAERSLYLPTGLLDPDDIPEYLTGELAGDYGYDPLGLGKDGNVAKYREAELIHARWAMLGALGAIVPEAIQAFGKDTGNGEYAVWWKTGAALLDGG